MIKFSDTPEGVFLDKLNALFKELNDRRESLIEEYEILKRHLGDGTEPTSSKPEEAVNPPR